VWESLCRPPEGAERKGDDLASLFAREKRVPSFKGRSVRENERRTGITHNRNPSGKKTLRRKGRKRL